MYPSLYPYWCFQSFSFKIPSGNFFFHGNPGDNSEFRYEICPYMGIKPRNSKKILKIAGRSQLQNVPPPFLAPIPHQLGYKVVGYIKFSMFLHVFSNVPHQFHTIRGTTKGVHFSQLLGAFSENSGGISFALPLGNPKLTRVRLSGNF